MISRKLKLQRFAGLLLAALTVGMFYSCSDNDDASEDTARIMVHMTDAPGDYDAVFVDVVDVMIHVDANASGDDGWQTLGNIRTGVYDLLTLTGGVTQLLADSEIPAGHLGQIRLVLGNNNSVVINGESQALSTPSAQQSGLKLNVNQTIEAGNQYEFLLDFDVDQSIVSAGTAGGYALKPVIRLANMEGTGTISGEVQPSLTQHLVRATNANHSISAYTDANGGFSLNGVPTGTYQVTITPAAGLGLQVKTVNNVQVTAGASADLEVIFLQ